MSSTDDVNLADFYSNVVLSLKRELDRRNVSFFPNSPDPDLETYWTAVRTRSESHITAMLRDGGASALRELGLVWAREGNVLLSKNIVPLTDLYSSIMSGRLVSEEDEDEEVSEFVYPLF